jgi:co-chaperonin GroES (HSP10)
VIEKQREHHIAVSIEPLDDWLVVEPGDAETWTRGGLIVPAGADAGGRTGIVTAVGPDAAGVELGDKVLFHRDAGFEMRVAGVSVRVVRRDDLIARIHD